MSCYHPLYRLDLSDQLHRDYVGSIDRILLKREHNKGVILGEEEKNSLIEVKGFKEDDFQSIPCGRCIGCRLDYSRKWAVRNCLEMETSKSAYFITLTYNDDHLPRSVFLDTETGVVNEVPELVPDDLQKFMKRLRAALGSCRFFACGEYGNESGRPHYHLIVYNLEIPDLKFFKMSWNGDPYYTSQKLEELWPFGFVLVAGVTFDSICYVSRYVLKKKYGNALIEFNNRYQIEDHGVLRNFQTEFLRMSRKPGIGKTFFDENYQKIYEGDTVVIARKGKAFISSPPRYFDNQLEKVDPVLFLETKNRREIKKEGFSSVPVNTSLSEQEYRDLLERVKVAKAEFLQNMRNKV